MELYMQYLYFQYNKINFFLFTDNKLFSLENLIFLQDFETLRDFCSKYGLS